jgi:DNA-binding response OmpR family regulator
MTKASILYVEDDLSLSFVTKDNLELKGYFVKLCKDGEAALKEFNDNIFNICILDVMLPKIDGFSIAQKIRETNKEIPIIFLTAKSDREDKLHGLKLGADDYITKPYSIEELILKIEIFLKRSKVFVNEKQVSQIFKLGIFIIDFENYTIRWENEVKKLTQRETKLLQLFCLSKNTVLKREEILKAIWDTDDYFSGRSLDVFISKLRKYLKADQNIKIENIHNVGFILKISS